MKLTTSQCRSVWSAMPFSAAIACAIRSFHCAALVRKPSASTSTGASAIRVMVISSSSVCVHECVCLEGVPLAGGRHRGSDAWDLPAGQQRVPVGPLEHQLAEVVEARFAQ